MFERSYGDSTRTTLSESSTVEDGQAVMEFLSEIFKNNSDPPHILVWGHSLGTSIATKTLIESQQAASMTKGLILESPFNTMQDELNHFKTVRWTAWLLGVVSPLFYL